MYKTIYTNNLTEQQIFNTMQNFGKTILSDVVLLDNNKIKAKKDVKRFSEKLKVIALYKYNTNKFIKI